jgi:hypothetical protein
MSDLVPPRKQIIGIVVVAAVVIVLAAGTGVLNYPTAFVAGVAGKVKAMFKSGK